MSEPQHAHAQPLKLGVDDHFLHPHACAAMIQWFQASLQQYAASNPAAYFSNRQINYSKIPHDAPIKSLMNQCRWRLAGLARRTFNVDDLFPDYSDLVHWPPGFDMDAHADNTYQDGSPGMFPWRTHSAILYLNDGYTGGATFFQRTGQEVIPQVGRAVAFGAGLEYTHGVRRVLEGDRYTMAIWFCQDPERLEI